MIDRGDTARRRSLGDFIRVQRHKLVPGDAGLPVGMRRRTAGLRREEVAQLSGLSTTWYTWIEQGRDVSISPAALGRIATALRLARAERAYLFELAGKHDPADAVAPLSDVSADVVATVNAIVAPAYVLDGAWNAKAWNAPAEHLLVGWLDKPGDRNLLRFIFLEPSARRLILDWEQRAQRVVAEFRAFAASRLNDPIIRELVEDLRSRSPDFDCNWRQQLVLSREGGTRTFGHPTDGFVCLRQVTFNLADSPGTKLTILVPPTDMAAGAGSIVPK